ncbi:MAG: DNA repair protein RecO [bacterium]|nr:DNA repair protein RecO [bacterium]
MSEALKTRALVLFRRPLGEADEIIGLFSPRRGRVDAVARGSKKISSAWVGKVEPFAELNAMLTPGRQLYYLSQAEMLHSFRGIYQNYGRLCWGSFFLELWSALPQIEDTAECEEVYGLILRTLQTLESSKRFRLLGCWSEWNLLRILGQQPFTSSCVRCGSNFLAGYSYTDGGVLCDSCIIKTVQAVYLPRRMLIMLQRLPFLTSDRAVVAEADATEMRRLEEIVWRHWCACGLPLVRARNMVNDLP